VGAAFLLAGCGGSSDKGADGTTTARASHEISLAQGATVKIGAPKQTVLDRFGPPEPASNPRKGCIYYAISDQRSSVWEFCFEKDKVVSASSFRR
jgi:hypothetical protein